MLIIPKTAFFTLHTGFLYVFTLLEVLAMFMNMYVKMDKKKCYDGLRKLHEAEFLPHIKFFRSQFGFNQSSDG